MDPQPRRYLRQGRNTVLLNNRDSVLQLLNDSQVDNIAQVELTAIVEEREDLLRSLGQTMQNDHRLLPLSHQLNLVVDQLCDDRVLGVRV